MSADAPRGLQEALDWLQRCLEASAPDSAPAAPGFPAALERLAALVGLDAFEQSLLLLAAAPELDSAFGAACAAAHDNIEMAWPTLGLALGTLPGGYWDALAEDATLRRLGLIRVRRGPSLLNARLSVDERVWMYLLGRDGLSGAWSRCAVTPPAQAPLLPSQEKLAREIAAAVARNARGGRPPVVHLMGPVLADLVRIAGHASELLEVDLLQVDAALLPADPESLDAMRVAWTREVVLSGRGLLLTTSTETPDDTEAPARQAALRRLTDDIPGMVVIAGRERRPLGLRPAVFFDVPRPTAEEQIALWEALLLAGEGAPGLSPEQGRPAARRFASSFDLDAAQIAAAAARAAGRLALLEGPRGPSDVEGALRDACRDLARPQIAGLAQRVEGEVRWEQLVVPDACATELRELVDTARSRWRVQHEWGFGDEGAGLTALFAGPSGTGKTFAARAVAGALGLDLWRVDLSAVTSKYIGETEKNLRRLFDAADAGGAVLLFDEADALFGRRSEVRDSRDRYANLEVSYLLQRLESYRGVALLTSNLAGSIDSAFLRRLRFVVEFPFPDREARARIWAGVFPPSVPTEGLLPERLAQLHTSGAGIRDIALRAAYLAAGEGRPVSHAHIQRAARAEYRKRGQVLSERELAGWA